MKTKMGLLKYSYYSVSGSLALIFVLCIGFGVAFLVTGNNLLFGAFSLVSIGAAPYVYMTKTGDSGNWDKFMVAMPIKRADIITNIYLSILILMLFRYGRI